MKKSLLVAALVSSGALVNVQAADFGTITFNGEITDQTCAVEINGSSGGGTADATITLPSVGTSSLASLGATTGSTPFAITVSGCADKTELLPVFEAGADVDLTTGRLNNDATGTATNVQLEILDNTGSAIKVGDHATQTAAPYAIFDSTAGFTDFNYVVRYYATGTAGAGSVSSKVTYTLVYK